jgi:predicted acyl esterase
MGALYQARTWNGLSGGASPLAAAGPFTLDTSANDPHQVALDPVRQNGDPDNACRTMDSDVATGNAAAEWPQTDPVTMLGIPTITATADPTADNLYIAARVWDVAPDGLTQTLVDRGVVRLGAAGTQSVSFHLNGNGYKFKAGHTIKLELTANDHPTFKAPANSGTISVTAVDFELPVADATKLVP